MMMRRIVILFFSVLCFSALRPSAISKGFAALKIYDYFLAKKYFYKALKKNPCAAAYGLSVIYFRKDNPFHNYDSAYKFAVMSKFSFSTLDLKKKTALKKIPVNDSLITMHCDSVFINAHEYYIKKAEKSEKPDSILNHYIDFFLFSSWREEALKQRDNFVFSESKKNYRSTVFENFILTWPESFYLNDAIYLWEKTIYEEKTTAKNIAEYKSFIDSFPKNRFVKSAQDEIFFIHKKKRDKNGLISFIRTFPKNDHTIEAWKLFFTLSVSQYTPENLAEFALDYPDFPLKKTIIEEINLLNKKLLRVKTNEKFGFIDTSGKMVIEPVYDDVEEFSEGLAITADGDKYGYIDKNGKWAIQAVYDEAEPFHDGVAIVRINKKALLVDRTGTVVSDEFDEISDFNEGLAVVRKNGKHGAVNRLGNNIIPLEYDKLGDFKEGHAWFEKEGKYGIIDKQNFVNIFNEYEWVDNFGEFIRARKNGLYGVINKNGEAIIPFEFERIENYRDEIFIVVKSGRYGIMDKTACYYQFVEFDFDAKWKAEDLVSGKIFKLYKEDAQALVNQNGKMLADFDEYEEIYLPSENIIRYMNNEKYGYNDVKMHPAFKGTYDEAEDFTNGTAIVVKKEKFTIIDKTGTVLFNEPCEEIERFESVFFVVTRNNLKGLLNPNLQWFLPAEYQEIEKVNENYFELKKDGKKMLYSISENKIIWSE